MIRKLHYIFILTSLLVSAGACDEGRIYNVDKVMTEDGGSARFSGEVTGSGTWSEGYTLALAGFGEGSDYAVISKNIGTSVADGKCDITLSGIPADVTTIELCAIDRLRRRVATFLSVPYNPHSGTLQMSGEDIDISMAAAIQNEIFNTTCVQCHGGTGHAAAGLDLLAGNSFRNLVSVPSRKIPDMERVKPGNSGESELFLILDSDISAGWNYDHSVEVVHGEKLDLIRNWIDNGAKTGL